MKQILHNVLLLLVLLQIGVISAFAQDPTIPPQGAGDTLARLATDTSKISNVVQNGHIIYEETGNSIRYFIKKPIVEGEEWLPASTVEALRTYYLLNEIQNEKINQGQMIYLKPETTKLLNELENNWSRRKIIASQKKAISELKSSYVNALQRIHYQVINYAELRRKNLTIPYQNRSLPFAISVYITIATNRDRKHVWLVGETDFRLAKRYDVEPHWTEVGGTVNLAGGKYRYKIEWNNGQQEISTAPFKIERQGTLTLPGAILIPN